MKRLLFITTLIISLSFSVVVSGATINHKKAYTVPKQSFKLKIKGTKKVKWFSCNNKIAVVKNGKVKTKTKGTVVIIGKAGKKKYKCKVRIYSINGMRKKLKKTYKIINKGYNKTYGHETMANTKKTIKALKKLKRIGYSFAKDLVGKKQRKWRNKYFDFRDVVQGIIWDEEALLEIHGERDEYGYHIKEYDDLEDNIFNDSLKEWSALLDLSIETSYYGY